MKIWKSYSRTDGTFQLVIKLTRTELTFSRKGFRLVELIICPSNDYHTLAPVQMVPTFSEGILYRLPPPPKVFAASNLASRLFDSDFNTNLPINVASNRLDFSTSILDGTIKSDKTSTALSFAKFSLVKNIFSNLILFGAEVKQKLRQKYRQN